MAGSHADESYERGSMTEHGTKIDLTSVSHLWGFAIHGTDARGTVDLEFKNVVSAAAFVAANELENRTVFTNPGRVNWFNDPVTISIMKYTDVFHSLD